jgi:hypothetical protein
MRYIKPSHIAMNWKAVRHATVSSLRNLQNSVVALSHSARLQHRHSNPEIDERPAKQAVDPDHHAVRLPESGGRFRGKSRHTKAPQRAVEDEDQAESQEGERLVRRISRDKLRQERQEKTAPPWD